MKRIRLMQAVPVVYRGDNSAAVTGNQMAPFRLLILRNGSAVSKNDLAGLNVRENGAFTEDSARHKIRKLRNQLGDANDGLIQSVHSSGYAAKLDGWTVDALHFEKSIGNLECSLEQLLLTPISPQQASTEINYLTTVRKEWEANPAEGLHDSGYRLGLELEAHYDELKRRADHRLIMLQLYSGKLQLMLAARDALEAMVRKGEVTPVVWKLLMYAHHALGEPRQTTFGKVDNFYKDNGGVPSDLIKLHISLGDPNFSGNPFLTSKALESPEGPISTASASTATGSVGTESSPGALESEKLIGLCKSLGISSFSTLRDEDSELAPLSCIRQTQSHLAFAGVLASKWVNEPNVRAKLDELLNRLDRDNGEVRFLIINPNGNAFKRLAILRNYPLEKDSLVHLRTLIERHKSFSVKVIDALPSFRIVAIDDKMVSFSPYRLAADAYLKAGRGLDTPYVMLSTRAEYPLAHAFRLLFEENWKSKDAEFLQNLP